MATEPRQGAWSAEQQRSYLRDLKPYIIASVLLILAGAVIGFATSTYVPKVAAARNETLREFSRLFLGLPKPLLAVAIFLNNSAKTLAMILLGTFAGLVPLIFLLVNGYVLGLVFHASLESRGALAFLLAIAPHGVFELPAILLGTSVGLRLGAKAIKRFLGKDEKRGGELACGLRFFAAVILPLLFVAALIEAFVTASVSGK
jgi:stage II sporulation protein M